MSCPRLALGMLAVALLAGCARSRCCVPCSPATSSPTNEQALSLPPVVRGVLIADVDALGQSAELDLALGALANSNDYYALRPQECQCLAAAHSSVGNLLDGERRAAAASNSKKSGGSSRVEQEVLRLLAAEARNSSAGTALELYYHLAEAEAGSDQLQQSAMEVEQANRSIAILRERGLEVPSEADGWRRQGVALRGEAAVLEAGIETINSELSRQIGRSTTAGVMGRIWPETDLTVSIEPLDVEGAVETGLRMRPELNALRTLEQGLASDNLHVVRGLLKAINPVLGMAADPPELTCLAILHALFCKDHDSSDQQEAAARRAQVRALLTSREIEVAAQVRQAAADIELRLREISVARDQVELWRERLYVLEARRPTGESSLVDVTTARLQLIQAQRDVTAKVVAWKIAVVKFREAQGLLIYECQPDAASAGMQCVIMSTPAPPPVVHESTVESREQPSEPENYPVISREAAAYMNTVRQRTLAVAAPAPAAQGMAMSRIENPTVEPAIPTSPVARLTVFAEELAPIDRGSYPPN